MKKVLVILGPTATGKTDLALQLAGKFQGELISADSRQVYEGLDIGTGKDLPVNSKFNPSITLRVNGEQSRTIKNQNSKLQIKSQKYQIGYYIFNRVSVWMIDVVKIQFQYTVADYVRDANIVIEGILKREKLPIVVGGTGLYIKALFEDLEDISIPINEKLRGELEELTLEELQIKLQKLAPQRWQEMNNSDRQNRRRLLRSIEKASMYGHRKIIQSSKFKTCLPCLAGRQAAGRDQRYNLLKIGLMAPRQILNSRIDLRLLARIDQGMVAEAKRLHQDGLSYQRMRSLGLEYGCLADYLQGKLPYDQFVNKLQNKIHQYAKRQMVWFARDKSINWFDISQKGWQGKLEKVIGSWYDKPYDQKN